MLSTVNIYDILFVVMFFMDKKAAKFYELKEKYQNILYKISFDVVQNRLRAERVVLKVLESLSRHLGTFDDVNSYKTAYIAVMLTKIEAEGIEDASSTGDDVFSDVDELSFFEVDTYSIIRALEELPERYSFYLVLRYEYGFDDEGMADLLGTHPANIRSELCRATNALNTRLNDVAVAGAERVEDAKDKVCAVLPSFVNNIGAAFLNMECEPVEFSEEFEEVAVYTPPPPKPYESKGIYVLCIIGAIVFALFIAMVRFNPTFLTDIGLVEPEIESSSTSKLQLVTSSEFVFKPVKPSYTPTGYTILDEQTTDNTYYVCYAYYDFDRITMTQTVYNPDMLNEANKYHPKYLRDFPKEDTIYYFDGEKSVIFFHDSGYTFTITSSSSDLYHVKILAQSIIEKNEFWWRYE